MSDDPSVEGAEQANRNATRGNCTTVVLKSRSQDAVSFDFDEALEIPQLGSQRYAIQVHKLTGGMGNIFLAHDQQLSRMVAVKILRSTLAADPRMVAAFENESRLMGYLSHPGITPVYERGKSLDGRPYHVMKWVEGQSFAEFLHGSEQNSLSEKLRIFADICQTMAYAHARGIIHSDLKPSNILVGIFGEVYVTDWGLARLIENQPDFPHPALSHTERTDAASDPIHGTLEYMPPEQARGDSLDRCTDVFALGAMLCEILVGQAPYGGDSVRQVYRSALGGKLAECWQRLDQCDADQYLVKLVKRCLSPSRKERLQDANQMAMAMADYHATALQRLESDMDLFFELSPELFCIADLEGHFVRVNANFPALLGFTVQELLSRPFLAFVHPDDTASTIAQMDALRHSQPVARFRNRYQTASGGYVTLEWTAKPIMQKGRVFAVARDVTPSRVAET